MGTSDLFAYRFIYERHVQKNPQLAEMYYSSFLFGGIKGYIQLCLSEGFITTVARRAIPALLSSTTEPHVDNICGTVNQLAVPMTRALKYVPFLGEERASKFSRVCSRFLTRAVKCALVYPIFALSVSVITGTEKSLSLSNLKAAFAPYMVNFLMREIVTHGITFAMAVIPASWVLSGESFANFKNNLVVVQPADKPVEVGALEPLEPVSRQPQVPAEENVTVTKLSQDFMLPFSAKTQVNVKDLVFSVLKYFYNCGRFKQAAVLIISDVKDVNWRTYQGEGIPLNWQYIAFAYNLLCLSNILNSVEIPLISTLRKKASVGQADALALI